MNRKKKPNRSRTERIQPSVLAGEIRGCCDLGMKREALNLARAVFRKKRIAPEEFFEALRAVGVYSGFKKWHERIQKAYDRQSHRFQSKCRPEMMELYAWLRDWKKAIQFLSISKITDAHEIFCAMEVLLALDKIEEAAELAKKCQKALSRTLDPEDQGVVASAFASFCARIGEWDKTIACLQRVPLDHGLRRDRLVGIVEIHLARAFEAVENGLQALAGLKRQSNSQFGLAVPDNDLALTRNAEKQLLKLRRRVEQLLPSETRKQLTIEERR